MNDRHYDAQDGSGYILSAPDGTQRQVALRPSATPAVADPEGLNILDHQRAHGALRERYLHHFAICAAAGYLDKDEHGRRIAAAMNATSALILERIAADLPPLGDPAGIMHVTRVSDTDRDAYAAHLHYCHAEGRLTTEEHQARQDRALSAVTLDDLKQLITDLPPMTARRPRPLMHPGTAAPPRTPQNRAALAFTASIIVMCAPAIIFISLGYGNTWPEIAFVLPFLVSGTTGALVNGIRMIRGGTP